MDHIHYQNMRFEGESTFHVCGKNRFLKRVWPYCNFPRYARKMLHSVSTPRIHRPSNVLPVDLRRKDSIFSTAKAEEDERGESVNKGMDEYLQLRKSATPATREPSR